MQKMKIVLVEPLKSPKVIEIDHELKIMQSVVGGDIACTYPWPDLAGLIYADDGIALGYPLNRMLKDEDGKVYDVIHGTFFIAGLTEDSFGSLSDELAEKFVSLFRYPEMYMRTMDGHVLCFKLGSSEEPMQIA